MEQIVSVRVRGVGPAVARSKIFKELDARAGRSAQFGDKNGGEGGIRERFPFTLSETLVESKRTRNE